MVSLGRELAAGSDLWLTAEKEGWWQVGHQPLAGGGESRRPKGVSNPRVWTKIRQEAPGGGDRPFLSERSKSNGYDSDVSHSLQLEISVAAPRLAFE